MISRRRFMAGAGAVAVVSAVPFAAATPNLSFDLCRQQFIIDQLIVVPRWVVDTMDEVLREKMGLA